MRDAQDRLIDSRVGVGCAYLTKGILNSAINKLVHAALDVGAMHFDVAPQYGRGTAEQMLGIALKGYRSNVTITSKVGIPKKIDSNCKLFARSLASPVRTYLRSRRSTASFGGGRTATNFKIGFVKESVRDTLECLQTDYLDALLLHMVSPNDLTHELLDFLCSYRDKGVFRAIGLATTVEDSHAITSAYPGVFDIVQRSWSVSDDVSSMDMFVITHGVIVNSLFQIKSKQNEASSRIPYLSELLNVDLFDSNVLAKIIIGAAASNNCDGTILVASRDRHRLVENIRNALDQKNIALGKQFLQELSCNNTDNKII